MSDLVSPPTYGQEEPVIEGEAPLQVLITPCAGATTFQSGYLGADNEHASIEGEVQIKGAASRDWDNVTIALRTVETVENRDVELAVSQLVLFQVPRQSTSSQAPIYPPATLPFSIPLTADIPQAVSTPSSSITHMLVATLNLRASEPVVKSTELEILRYTTADASSSDFSPDPVVVAVDTPSRATVQIPRAVYRVGEPIPIYVTIPPPERSTVASGLRLRNVKAEFIREVQVGTIESTSRRSSSTPTAPPEAGTSQAASSSFTYPPEKESHFDSEGVHTSVLRRSGAACRFHSSRPIKLRLVLHDSESSVTGNITQTSLLHHVSFHIQLTVSYTSTSHSSPISTVNIPIVILPPFAPTREGDFSKETDTAYHKKHDPPPTRTNRADDLGEGSSELPAFEDHPGGGLGATSSYAPPSGSRQLSAGFHPPPSFTEASASTSLAHNVEPPSFDDAAGASTHRVVLPLSFDYQLEPETSGGSDNHLPSFIESESEVTALRPPEEQSPFGYWAADPGTDHQALHFAGEGTAFGFTPLEQYDGISHSMMQTAGAEAQSDGSGEETTNAYGSDGPSFRRGSIPHLPASVSPPPPGIDESIAAAVSAAFATLLPTVTHSDGDGRQSAIPPPPPALDDPSDPPPSIDDGVHSLSHAQQSRRERAMVEAAVARAGDEADAPPPAPVVVPTIAAQEESRPPPYLGVPQPVTTTGPPPYVG